MLISQSYISFTHWIQFFLSWKYFLWGLHLALKILHILQYFLIDYHFFFKLSNTTMTYRRLSLPNNVYYNFFFLNFGFIYLFIYLFIYGCAGSSFLREGFLQLGQVEARCAGLSLSRPLLLRSTGFRRAGSAIVAHGPNCSVACGILPDQGSNPHLLHWQADSQPLRHQGSPIIIILIIKLAVSPKYIICSGCSE